MSHFPTPDMEITTLLVVSDTNRSRDWYRDVPGAELYRAYGSSVVMKFLGHWLLPESPRLAPKRWHALRPEHRVEGFQRVSSATGFKPNGWSGGLCSLPRSVAWFR